MGKVISLSPTMYAEAMKMELSRTGIRFVEYVLGEDGDYEEAPERVFHVGETIGTTAEVLALPKGALCEVQDPENPEETLLIQVYAARQVWTVSGRRDRYQFEELLPVRVRWLP
jgi:hypothetical protein